MLCLASYHLPAVSFVAKIPLEFGLSVRPSFISLDPSSFRPFFRLDLFFALFFFLSLFFFARRLQVAVKISDSQR